MRSTSRMAWIWGLATAAFALHVHRAVAFDPPPPPPPFDDDWPVVEISDGSRLIGAYVVSPPVYPNGLYALAVWKVNAAGALDPAFGSNGYARLPVFGICEVVQELGVLPDGKIVVAGSATDPLTVTPPAKICSDRRVTVLARLDADGNLDYTFNGNGRVALDVDAAANGPGSMIVSRELPVTGIQARADGGIDLRFFDSVVARLTADGRLDTSFRGSGSIGRVIAPYVREYFLADAQGLWYASPAESEAGWGVSFAQQGEVIFATWFTYGAGGKPWWLTAMLTRTGEGVYAGRLLETRGPALDATPFDPAQVIRNDVGNATLTFADRDHATFAYNLKPADRGVAVSQSRAITRQVFGPRMGCSWGTLDIARATNYQDLWWASPAGSEAGWGLGIAHQGDTIFATWFTYGRDGTPLWLSGTATKVGDGSYAGTLNRTTGPVFDAIPWDKSQVTTTAVGTFTLDFADGDRGTFGYRLALGGTTIEQSKPMTRQVFRGPGTTCR